MWPWLLTKRTGRIKRDDRVVGNAKEKNRNEKYILVSQSRTCTRAHSLLLLRCRRHTASSSLLIS